MIVCNTRSLCVPLTGVQRYTSEILNRIPDSIDTVQPKKNLRGIRGHAWEQIILPHELDGRLLWSPGNTGPLRVEKQVVSIMDVSPLDHPEWSSRQFSSWYKFLLPRLISRVRGILTISEFSRRRILHYCPSADSKVHVTLLAADRRFQPVDDFVVTKTANFLGLPSSHYIVVLCSLEPRKNLKTLIQAWKQVQRRLPDEIWLVLAGAKGSRLVFGNQSYEDLPSRVYLTGHVPDEMLPALYTGAMASVYLSFYEGFGLPPLESMACGTPVLSSNATSLPEVVGDAALAVDPFDAEAIGENLVRLVEDSSLRFTLGQRGLARARLFDWDKTAQQTWIVLKQAAS